MRFRAPLVDDGYASEARGDALLVYLPGFDGSNLAPFLQWPALGDAGFDVRCGSVDPSDRSEFDELVPTVTDYLRAEAKSRPIFLVGESFGGILATAAATRGARVDGLVLVNPATCYPRSALAARGPGVAALPSWLYPFGLLSLLPLFVDKHSARSLLEIVLSRRLPAVIDEPRKEAYRPCAEVSVLLPPPPPANDPRPGRGVPAMRKRNIPATRET